MVAVSGAALADVLADEVLASSLESPDGVTRRTILWLDPLREFERLWPFVAASLEARSARPFKSGEAVADQLRLKLALLRFEKEPTGRAVIYLPGADQSALEPRADGTAPALWAVYEHRYKGIIWSLEEDPEPGRIPQPTTLLGWLERHGLRLAEGPDARRLTDGGRDSLLARYAEIQRDRTPSEWPSPLKESEVLAGLGGDSRDALRALIAAPKNAVRLWGETAELTFKGIEQTYGLEPPTAGLSPDQLADAFVSQLALTEAWEALGRPSDFPFRTRLPERQEQLDRAVRFLRVDVLQDVELGPRYRQRMLRLEKDIDLSKWAADRPGQPRGLPLLARSRWNTFIARFDNLAKEDWREARTLLLESTDAIAAGRATPWDRIDGDTLWFVVDDVRMLAQREAEATDELKRLRLPADMVAAYVARWWEIDRLHLRVRAASSRASGLDRVRRVADLTYFDYVEAANEQFSAQIEAGGSWPPDGLPSASDLATRIWSSSSLRRAVIISDALRWDLARGLEATISSLELMPVFSTIPTTTPFGMTALLPLGTADLEVVFGKNLLLRAGQGSPVGSRDGRKAFLEASVRKDGNPAVGFVDMEELLQGPGVPNWPILVVLDNSIDEQGHKGTEELPGLAGQLISKLRRTIERLHEAGIGEVHVVTDHGFLLLPADMVNGLGKPDVQVGQVLRRETRWCALKPDAPISGLIRLPLPRGKQRPMLGFPRGVRTLVETGDFFHGGISLQETVIPYAVSRAALGPTRLDVQVGVRTTGIITGTVPVVVRPAPTGLFDQHPTRVRLWVERASAPGDAVAEPVEVEVRADVEELKPPLYLKEGSKLRAGAEVVLRAIDLENGRELARIPLRMLVDWD